MHDAPNGYPVSETPQASLAPSTDDPRLPVCPPPVVVIPCFDEERRLDPAALRALAAEGSPRLLLVDDGSGDRTLSILRELEADSPNIDVLALERNRGKAEAVRAGLLRAIDDGADDRRLLRRRPLNRRPRSSAG